MNLIMNLDNGYALPRASEEQKHAVGQLRYGNVMIEAVAGSGKTTTVLYASKVFHAKKILLLTYNAKLKFETRAKATALGFKNLEVHSYHSFCTTYINRSCCTDAGIIQYLSGKSLGGFDDMLANDITPTLKRFDMIIIDESQDMTFVYYELVQKIMNVSPDALLCVLGDRYQNIYEFNKADKRFLMFADKVFPNLHEWRRATLSTSYRITHQMADFVNKCVLGRDHMTAVSHGIKPRYLFITHDLTAIANEIRDYLDTGYTVDDIFVLAYSVRTGPQSPITKLSNLLSKRGIPVYMPGDDDRKLDEEVLKNKLVFSSFHQSKGLERKCVIVMGFDSSYIEFYQKNRETPTDVCPNEIYVAITRAKEKLILVHNVEMQYLPFLNVNLLPEYCDMVGAIEEARNVKREDKAIPVTTLNRHIPSDVVSVLMSMITVETISPPTDALSIQSKTIQIDPFGNALAEEVSDITGTAIPAYYQYMISSCNSMDIQSALPRVVKSKLKMPLKSPAHLLEIANRYDSMRNNLVYRVNQIHQYDWLSVENLEHAYQRLAAKLNPDVVMETEFRTQIAGRVIGGFIDAITPGVLWEIKCVRELLPEHILQIALYAMMHQTATGVVYTYYLYNVATDELKQVSADLPTLIKIARVLIHYKYHATSGMNDTEFLLTAERIRDGKTGITSPVHECKQCAQWRDIEPVSNKVMPPKRAVRQIKKKKITKAIRAIVIDDE